LLSTPLLTDANGDFTVTAGSYTCPLGSSTLYAVATEGVVAGSGTASNDVIALMTVPGTCSAVSAGPPYVLDEITTLASVYAFRPFLGPGAQMGSTATNTSGLGLAATTLASLANLTTGTSPGQAFPLNGTSPAPRLNSLANVLHECLVAPAGAGSVACASLFAATTVATTAPTNVLDAALSIADHPGNHAAALFTLGQTSSAFVPALATAPADWTLPIAFTGGGVNEPTAVAIDSVGRIWVTNRVGVASLFSNTGVPAFPNGITGYGLNGSVGGAVDAHDQFWVTNQGSDPSVNNGKGSVTVLNSSGPAFPGTSYITAGGLYEPIAVAFDESSTAWVLDYYDNAVTVLSDTGVPLSGSSGYGSTQFAFANGIAVDKQGNGWVANSTSDAGTVTEIASDGSTFTSYVVGAGPSAVAVDADNNIWSANYFGDSIGLVSAGHVRSGSGFTGGGVFHPLSLQADSDGTIWVANYRLPGISQLAGASTHQPGQALSPDAGWAPDLGMVQAQSLAIDAAGNIWVVSNGDGRIVEFVGLAAPVKTPLLGSTRVP